MDKLELRVWDLLDIYAMTRPGKRQIVEHLPDSERWVDLHVMLSGNYCLPIFEDPFSVPTLQGDHS